MSVRLVELLGPPPPAASPHVEATGPLSRGGCQQPDGRIYGCSGVRVLSIAFGDVTAVGLLSKAAVLSLVCLFALHLVKRLGCFQLKIYACL